MVFTLLLTWLAQTDGPLPRLSIAHETLASVLRPNSDNITWLGTPDGGRTGNNKDPEGFLSEDGRFFFERALQGGTGLKRFNLQDGTAVGSLPHLFRDSFGGFAMGLYAEKAARDLTNESLGPGATQPFASRSGEDVLLAHHSHLPQYAALNRWFSGVGVIRLVPNELHPMIAGATGFGRAIQPIMDVRDLSLSLVVAGVGTVTPPPESETRLSPDDSHGEGSIRWPRSSKTPKLHEMFLGSPYGFYPWDKPRVVRGLLWNSETNAVVAALPTAALEGGVPSQDGFTHVAIGKADGSKPRVLSAPAAQGRQGFVECISLTSHGRVFVGVKELDANRLDLGHKPAPVVHRIYQIKGSQWNKVADARLRATNIRGDRWLVERVDGSGGWLVSIN